jgi:hypothetical protein
MGIGERVSNVFACKSLEALGQYGPGRAAKVDVSRRRRRTDQTHCNGLHEGLCPRIETEG